MNSRRLRPSLAALFAATLVFSAVLALDTLERKRALQDQRLHVTERLSSFRSRLESSFAQSLNTIDNLAVLYASRPGLAHREFEHLAERIVAPDSLIGHLRLIGNNELGDFHADSHEMPDELSSLCDEDRLRQPIGRAAASHAAVLAPPAWQASAIPVVPLLVPAIRHPDGREQIEGYVCAPIRVDRLLRDSGIAEFERELQIAIRTHPAGVAIHGKPDLFADSPVTLPVGIADGGWELAGSPREGWGATSPTLLTIRTLGAGLCLLAALLAFLLVRNVQRLAESENRLNASEGQLKQRTAELIHQNAVLDMLTHNAELPDILEMLAQLVEIHQPDMLCGIMLLDPDGLHLRVGAAPSLPEPMRQAMDCMPIGDGMGCCGAAAHSGRRVIVEDLRDHAFWQGHCHPAEQANLRSCWSQPIMDSAERVLGTFAIYHRKPAVPTTSDIMLIEHYAGLAALAIERSHNVETLHLHATALDSAANAVVITNLQGRIVWINRAYTKLTGYEFEEAVGRTHAELLKSGLHDSAFYAQLWDTLLAGNIWQGEIINRRKDGELFHDETTITPVRDSHDRIAHFVAIKQDISARKLDEEQLKNLAFYDPLTRLPNRRLLVDRLEQAIAACKRTGRLGALLFLDLDNFKPLNDEYGHDAGDLLLAEAARRILMCVRGEDTVARFGGDEFVVLIKDLDADADASGEQARLVADKIRAAVSDPYRIRLPQAAGKPDGVVHRCSASIGIALFDGGEGAPHELLKRADIAMYRAKTAERGSVFLDRPALHAAD